MGGWVGGGCGVGFVSVGLMLTLLMLMLEEDGVAVVYMYRFTFVSADKGYHESKNSKQVPVFSRIKIYGGICVYLSHVRCST